MVSISIIASTVYHRISHRRKFMVDFLFPLECMWCSLRWVLLCNQCLAHCNGHPEVCPLCHAPSSDYRVCIKCRTKDQKAHYKWILVAFEYGGPIKQGILWLKYYHCYTYAWRFISKLTILIQTHGLLSRLLTDEKSSIAVTYIPSHRYRHYFQKGYNQSQLLAQWVANELGLSLVQLTHKIRITHTQTWLNRSRRLVNLSKSFTLSKSLPPSIKTLIIVDDIVTTWSTINELARTILSSHPSIQIRWVAIGRDRGG